MKISKSRSKLLRSVRHWQYRKTQQPTSTHLTFDNLTIHQFINWTVEHRNNVIIYSKTKPYQRRSKLLHCSHCWYWETQQPTSTHLLRLTVWQFNNLTVKPFDHSTFKPFWYLTIQPNQTNTFNDLTKQNQHRSKLPHTLLISGDKKFKIHKPIPNETRSALTVR